MFPTSVYLFSTFLSEGPSLLSQSPQRHGHSGNDRRTQGHRRSLAGRGRTADVSGVRWEPRLDTKGPTETWTDDFGRSQRKPFHNSLLKRVVQEFRSFSGGPHVRLSVQRHLVPPPYLLKTHPHTTRPTTK